MYVIAGVLSVCSLQAATQGSMSLSPQTQGLFLVRTKAASFKSYETTFSFSIDVITNGTEVLADEQ